MTRSDGELRKTGRILLPVVWAAVAVMLTGVNSALVRAQDGAARLFDEGNVFYQQQEYASALDKYRQIEEQGQVSAALYYNRANCHYKLGQIGAAILYYERALRLAPGDEDIRANLAVANQATVDNIVSPPEFALVLWLRSTLYLVSPAVVQACLAVGYVALAGLSILLVLLRREALRTRVRRLLLVGVLLVAVISALGGLQWWDSEQRVEAVVQAVEVPVLSAPDEGGTQVFSIHEGTKVRMGETTGEWVEIVLADGKVGWVPLDVLEVI